MASSFIREELSASLSAEMLELCHQHLADKGLDVGQIYAVFDARGMNCPMPLLKAKVALRGVPDGGGLYLLASDKNSQTDLIAFCQKQALSVQAWTQEDTYHFIIIKPA